MTAKERQRMQRLEIENSLLRERASKDMDVVRNNIIEIIELKSTLELVQLAIENYQNPRVE